MQPFELPERFLAVTSLGPPVAVYRMAAWKKALMLAGAVIFAAAACSAPFLAAAGVGDMTREWYIGGAVVLLFAVGLAALVWMRGRNAFVMYEEGFAWKKGGAMLVHRWDQVAAITSAVTKMTVNFIPAGTSHKHTLDMKTGEKLVLTDNTVAQVGHVAAHIRENVVPLLFSEYAERYNRGENLEFGPIVIGQSLPGIQHKSDVIPWVEIEGTGVHEGSLMIRKAGRGVFRNTLVPVSTIPNFDVLMAVLEGVSGPAEPEQPPQPM